MSCEIHERKHKAERGRDGQALEVLGFTLCVLGDERDGRVEPREPGEAAADEAGEDDGVEVGAEAAGEGEERGGDAEGDLVRQFANGRLRERIYIYISKNRGGRER